MKHSLLDNTQEYIEETYDEFKNRYYCFGKDIYEQINSKEPEVFKNLKFYKAIKLNEKTSWNEPEVENSYAIYDDGNRTFGIQLEPLTPVICLYNDKTQIEIGDWSEDCYSEAISFIKNKLLYAN